MPVSDNLPLGAAAPISDDLVALLLADKRSPQTRRAYAGDLSAFTAFLGVDPTPATLANFCTASPHRIAAALVRWKQAMIERDLAPATINRRLAAVRSLLKFASRLGLARTDGRGLIDGERAKAYRDTAGIPLHTMRALLARPNRLTPKGRRDRAILLLLMENALRRAEVCSLSIEDVRDDPPRLFIQGKGRAGQKEPVSISTAARAALRAMLMDRPHAGPQEPLFVSLTHDPSKRGRLTSDGLYAIISSYGRQIKVPALTPHKLRHAAITAALDATGGDVRSVQRLSRHARLETLIRYDDNRKDLQGDVTRTLSDLLGEKEGTPCTIRRPRAKTRSRGTI